jgi:phosphoglucosamine mutase
VALFGTDGVRGLAGVDLTAELAQSLSAAAVAELAHGVDRPVVVVGRDPRPSGPWLQDAVVAGLTAAGADVVLVGIIPTPAVARAVADGIPGVIDAASFGVVISASHNPPADNGIKFFGAGGRKLDDATEAAIEARLSAPVSVDRGGQVVSDQSGQTEWYVDAVAATVPVSLGGMSVIVDCANGAAATVAGAAYAKAGADVSLINTEITGDHINDNCGATHLGALQAAVAAAGVDAGIAHDGDADRCLAVAADGTVIDGDAILAILALALHRRSNLRNDTVVATVMSNLGLHRLLRDNNITLVTTPVGDRHVAERMRAIDASVGGEQSGHIVLLDHATTGDGVLTGLHLLAAAAASAQPLGVLANRLRRLPQVLLNVRVNDAGAAMRAADGAIQAASARLGDEGRVLVRASGTEPLVRVMVEAETDELAKEIAQHLAAEVAAPAT